jgi:subtilisin
MTLRLARMALALLSAASLAAVATAPAGATAERPPDGDVIEGRYIVAFEESVDKPAVEINRREREVGFRAAQRYRHALPGFAARLSPSQVRELRADPEVDFVTPDRRVEASGTVPLAAGDTTPTGVRRILAATRTTARERSGAAVAVIDTGIQLSHPDLNAKHGTNCSSPGSPANDGNGHGTHVAGTIGAQNNGSGVVGVAPDTELYAVKVLGDNGSGSTASVVCGIEWVTANHQSLGIRVANMSLGGSGPRVGSCSSTTDAMHRAICESTAAGVNYVVAAGNEGWDFDYAPVPDVPAAYPQVLTVTAMADSDGEPGGAGGPPACRRTESDDVRASFSNYAATADGAAHTIAAPGVCIESTWRGGGHSTISGTSMASPHVAGVVALCVSESGFDGPCAGRAPAEVISELRSDAQAYNVADPGFGFLRDPLHSPQSSRYYGFLVRTLPAPFALAPASLRQPKIIGGEAPVVGEVLKATAGKWSNEPTEYLRQWLRCDAAGAGCVAITDYRTGKAYKPNAADVGHTLRARVIAINASGQSDPARSAPSGEVSPA